MMWVLEMYIDALNVCRSNLDSSRDTFKMRMDTFEVCVCNSSSRDETDHSSAQELGHHLNGCSDIWFQLCERTAVAEDAEDQSPVQWQVSRQACCGALTRAQGTTAV